MAALGIVGNRREVDRMLVQEGLKEPCLFIDCSNCTDPHKVACADEQSLRNFYVIPAESLYRFRPTLDKIEEIAKTLQVQRVIISTFSRLFNYDDKEENKDVYEYAWNIFSSLELPVLVGIEQGSVNEHIVREKHVEMTGVTMGHTARSQRMIVDQMIQELKAYGSSLERLDSERFEKRLKRPLKHVGSITHASSLQTWVLMLVSMLLEQERKIEAMESALFYRRLSQR